MKLAEVGDVLIDKHNHISLVIDSTTSSITLKKEFSTERIQFSRKLNDISFIELKPLIDMHRLFEIINNY